MAAKVLISGAGIAGCCLAWWLERYGYSVTVVEQAREARGGGYVIDFWGLGYEVTQKMGLVDESVPVRIMESTARGMLRTLPPPRKLPVPLALTLNPLARRLIASQAEKKVAQRARRDHYPAPYAILTLFTKYDGNALLARKVLETLAREYRLGEPAG